MYLVKSSIDGGNLLAKFLPTVLKKLFNSLQISSAAVISLSLAINFVIEFSCLHFVAKLQRVLI